MSMDYLSKYRSRVMLGTCERCVFNSGLHSESCPKRWQFVEGNGLRSTAIDWNLWIPVMEAGQRFRDAYLGHSEGVIYNIKVPE